MSTTPRTTGASVPSRSARDRFRAWQSHHRRVARESIASLMQNWMSSAMTWLVIGIALALPAILYVILVNVGSVSESWEGKPRFSLYLEESLTEPEGRSLARELAGRASVESIRYISAGEALEEFRARSGFGDVVASLDENPLPAVVVVVPEASAPAELRLVVSELKAVPGVASVSVDLAWIERLYAIVDFGERLVLALGVFLGLGVLLIIGNTIRLAIENRRSEIEVVKLVGGTDAFVRRPFLYLGLWYGLGGALIAWLLVQVSLVFLTSPVQHLARSYGNAFVISGLGATESLILWAGGAVLGVLGAMLAVRRHLHDIEPR